MKTINLVDLTDDGQVRNLTGHERGVLARAYYKLDEVDFIAEPVRVVVPDSVYTLTPSFFQGMFAESVQNLGESRDAFLNHYMFDASPIILRQIERGIINSLMRRGELLTG